MTFELLNKIIEENSIPKDVCLMSDSGWECNETVMNGIYYNRKDNTLIFTQCGDESDSWFKKDGWELLYGYNKLCVKCKYLDRYGNCVKRASITGRDFYVSVYNVSNCEFYERKE